MALAIYASVKCVIAPLDSRAIADQAAFFTLRIPASFIEVILMQFRLFSITCSIAVCLFATSCSPKAKPKYNKVPLTKVTGTVTVDGKQVSGVIIGYKPKGEIAEKDQRFLSGFNVMSAAEGKFALKTYESSDGVPAGDYEIFCQYFPIEGDDPRTSKAANDVLNGKYVKEPAKEFTVVQGQPLDLGTIELNTAKATTAKKK